MNDKFFTGIIIATVAVLVGLALWPAFAPNIGTMTQTTSAVRNVTYTMPAAGASVEITGCGQKILTGTVYNSTNGTTAVPSTNYTFTQRIGADGYLAAHVTTASQSSYASSSINVSCASYEPKGYVAEGGSRGLITLIGIFMALLIVVAAMPDLRNGVIDFFRG